MRASHLTFIAALAALMLPAAAPCSTLIDRNAHNVKLSVDTQGRALVSYTAHGKRWNVLASGAVDAIPPSRGKKQVGFELDYSGGWGTTRTDVWKTLRNACRPASGPPLAWVVTACTASDGSHWALQAWQRELPNYGMHPTAAQAVWELRLSHWTGELPDLTIDTNWAYRRFDHIFGTFTYEGVPVHGFRSSPAGAPLDSFGRNLYVDTFDSAYGPGWKRENSFLTHMNMGTFCYGFYPHGSHPSGAGVRYRATIIGPGVTPDVMWQGAPLGTYNAGLDRELKDVQSQIYGSDRLCKPV